MIELIIDEHNKERRADRFLSEKLELSHAALQKIFRKKKVRLNGLIIKSAQILKTGDALRIYENAEQREQIQKIAISKPLEVIYEDKFVIFVNKPKGLLTHGKNGEDSLIARLLARGFDYPPRATNRLDRNTSGLVLCAKTADSARALSEIFRLRLIKKRYLALVEGDAQDSGVLQGYHSKQKKRGVISSVALAHSKDCVLSYKVLKTKNGRSLLEIELQTGRFHQIRAQLAFVGHPLIGDLKYGADSSSKNGYALHSYSVVFAKDLPNPLKYLALKEFLAKIPSYLR